MAQYPYTTSPDQTADGLLTRPRFSTRRYDALFVRVEAVYADVVRIPPSRSPVGVFTDALESEPKSYSPSHLYLWNQVKGTATSNSDDSPLLAIFSDDTINLLSLVSTDPKEQALLGIPGTASTLVSPLSPTTETYLSPISNESGVSIPVRKPTLPSSTPQSPKDWAEFSSAGFGETTISHDFVSTLHDKDVEVTEPLVQRKPSRQKQNRNAVAPVEPSSPASDPKPVPEEPEGPKLILVAAEVVQLDEAFIDFWRDAVVDPISSDWPKFVVGELKHPLTPRLASTSSENKERVTPGNPINWIIIEEKFRRPTPPPTPVISHDTLATSDGLKVPATPLRRTSSPRPSFGEKKSSSLSATFKRFTLFGSSGDDLPAGNAGPIAGGSGKKDSFAGRRKFGVGKSPKIGEMGEAGLSEEPELQPKVPQKVDVLDEVEKVKNGKGNGKIVPVATGMVGGALFATTMGSDSGGPTKEDVKEDATTKGDQDDPPAKGKTEVPVTSDPEVSVSVPDTPASEESTPVHPFSSTTQHELAKEPELQTMGAESDTLPPAPESVVSHGETPGPQLALDSSEAGLHHVPDVGRSQVPAAGLTIPLPESVIQHLEDKVEDSAADIGVDLDPVPIIPDDPVKVQEVEEPEPPVTTDEPTAKDLVAEIPSIETPAPASEREFEPIPTHSIVIDGVTEDASPLPSIIPPSEELEKEVTVETTDIVTKEVPIAQTSHDG